MGDLRPGDYVRVDEGGGGMNGPRFEDLPENERARVYAMLKRAMFHATHLAPTFAAALNTLTREAGDDAIPKFKEDR